MKCFNSVWPKFEDKVFFWIRIVISIMFLSLGLVEPWYTIGTIMCELCPPTPKKYV